MTNEELELICQERKSAAELRDLAEAEVKRLNGIVGEELTSRGVERVELAGFTPQWVTQHRHTIDKFKLVEHGVPMETIEAATVTAETTFVRVFERKEEAGAGAASPPVEKKGKKGKKGKTGAEAAA